MGRARKHVSRLTLEFNNVTGELMQIITLQSKLKKHGPRMLFNLTVAAAEKLAEAALAEADQKLAEAQAALGAGEQSA